jgi:di/tricarboxylate transporter
MAAIFKVNGQGHRENNHTIGILDHENMGIAFGIVFLSAIFSVLWPFLKNLTMADFYV